MIWIKTRISKPLGRGSSQGAHKVMKLLPLFRLRGESGSGAMGGQEMGPSADDSGPLSDPDDQDFSTDVIMDEGEVLIGQVEEWRTDDEIADKYAYVETCEGKNIEYDFVGVNMNDLRSYVFGDAPPDEITDPIKIPEEIRLASHKWFKSLPDQTQKKRYVNTKGEYTGQIISWDFDEQHSLVMIK
ncbi:hypothetical protein Hdeb2414_s0034g00725501 [Helianthus debilis subsp. tardiflorus]